MNKEKKQEVIDRVNMQKDFYGSKNEYEIVDDEIIDDEEYLVTLEDLKRKYNIDKIECINFNEELSFISKYSVVLDDSPLRYIDVAKKAKELERIQVPTNKNQAFYKSLSIFVENCNDDVRICNGIFENGASKNEFLYAEEKIEELLGEIDPNWNEKQKIAYIHYRIGSLIAYIPDINYRQQLLNWRALNIWQSVAKEKSVCNGISYLETNILNRMGIDAKIIMSANHGYVVAKTEEGSIISDPTFDLAYSLYKRKPKFLGLSYDSIRKIDEDEEKDSHKVDKLPNDIIEISDKELIEIYRSIGVTDKDGNFPFPVQKFILDLYDRKISSEKEKFDILFSEFPNRFQQECMHMEETGKMIRDCIHTLDVQKENISSGFMYLKTDMRFQSPCLFFHINTDELKDEVRVFNPELIEFETVQLKDVKDKYRILDLKNKFYNKFIRPSINLNKEDEER